MFQLILKMKKLTFTINRMNNTIILMILLTKLFLKNNKMLNKY